MNRDTVPQQNITFDLHGIKGLHFNFFGSKQLAKNIIEKLGSFSHYGHIDISAIEESGTSTFLSPLTRKGMLISSLNVNGLIRILDELKLLLAENGLHIVALDKTKFDNNIANEVISVDGYTLRRNDRNGHGGGVAMYIKEGTRYTVRKDLPTHYLKIICIEEQPLRSEPFNVTTWYRPPNAPIDRFQQLERVLTYIDREGRKPYC